MRSLSLILLSLLLSANQCHAADPSPGMWNLTATVMIEGASHALGPYNQSRCLNKDDLQDPQKIVAEDSDAGCTYTDKKFEGNRFSFNVQCNGVLPMTGTGSVTYDADSFQGEININAKLESLEVNSTSYVAGKRVGDCATK